jgi:hypothetical protein
MRAGVTAKPDNFADCVSEKKFWEEHDEWDAQHRVKADNLVDQTEANHVNETECEREHAKVSVMVEAISPTAVSLAHFAEIKRSCINVAHAALRQMYRDPNSAEYATECAKIIEFKRSMDKGRSPMPLHVSLFITILTLSGGNVVIQEHFPEEHDMDTGLQPNKKHSNQLITKIDTVASIPDIATMIEYYDSLNAAVCEDFMSHLLREEPKLKGLVLLTMYNDYDNEKLKPLKPLYHRCKKFQLQAGPQKNVHGPDDTPLLVGKIMHLSLMPWTMVCLQAVGCICQAMLVCPQLKLSIPSAADMRKIERALCFPLEHQEEMLAIRHRQLEDQRNTCRKNWQVFLQDETFWQAYNLDDHTEATLRDTIRRWNAQEKNIMQTGGGSANLVRRSREETLLRVVSEGKERLRSVRPVEGEENEVADSEEGSDEEEVGEEGVGRPLRWAEFEEAEDMLGPGSPAEEEMLFDALAAVPV